MLCAGATVEQFEQAKNKLSTLKEDPGNEAKLKIYALFKQVGASCRCSGGCKLFQTSWSDGRNVH